MRISKIAMRKTEQLLLRALESPAAEKKPSDPRPEMVCFRGQVLAIVRHFFEISCQAGRLPSILGREFFRARVSHHAIPSFEEQVIFVRDIEICLAKLSEEQTEILTLVGMYHFSYDEAAEVLRCSRTRIHRCFTAALDSLAEIFLQTRVLSENRPDRRQKQISRQDAPYAGAPLGKKPPQSVKFAPAGNPQVTEEKCASALVQRPLLA